MQKIKIIIILVVCLVCAGAFFGYTFLKQKTTLDQTGVVVNQTDFEEPVFSKASVIEAIVASVTKRETPQNGYMNTAGWRMYTLATSEATIIYPPTWTIVQREGWEDETIFDRQQQELQGNALTTITPPTPLSDQDKISIGDGATVNCARFDESFYGQNTRIACVFSIPIYTRSTNPETLKVFDTIITNARKTSE